MKKLILTAAFLSLGTFTLAQTDRSAMQKKDPAQMEQKRAEKMKMMQAELNLTESQVSKITALQNKKMADRKASEPKMKAERKAKMDVMKAKNEQWNAEMKQILTPEQYTKWEAGKKNKMQEKRGMMQNNSMKRTPAN